MPTIAARQGRMILEALESLGLDATAIAREAGLDEAALVEPSARLEDVPYGRLFGIAHGTSGDALVALRAASVSGASGLLSYLAMSEATFRDGVLAFVRFATLAIDSLEVKLDEGGLQARLRLCFTGGYPRHASEYLAGLLAAHMRDNVSREPRPTEVRFPHPPAGPQPEYEALLGCPVRFRCDECELILSREILSRPYKRPNPEVARTLRVEAERELGVLRSDLGRKVEHVLRAGETASAPLDAVARKLGLSARTLQRRLNEQGTSFREVRDAVSLARAMELLADGSLNISEVAERLGFADISAFDNAFKRWTGETPRALRSRTRTPTSAAGARTGSSG